MCDITVIASAVFLIITNHGVSVILKVMIYVNWQEIFM